MLSARLRISAKALIVSSLLMVQQGYAVEKSKSPAQSIGPARVRIPLKLTPYDLVTMKRDNGQTFLKHVPLQPVEQVLRARLEKTNHFYFGNWHVESVPLRWTSATRQYSVRLNVYKRLGSYGDVEEKVGQMDVPGVLEGDGKLFTLVGTGTQQFKDSQQNPVVDITAGLAPTAATAKEQVLSSKVNPGAAPAAVGR